MSPQMPPGWNTTSFELGVGQFTWSGPSPGTSSVEFYHSNHVGTTRFMTGSQVDPAGLRPVPIGPEPIETGPFEPPMDEPNDPPVGSGERRVPPDGVVGIADVTAVLDKYKNDPGNVGKARADPEGCPADECVLVDQVVNISDVTYANGAYLGEVYPPPGFTPEYLLF